MCFTDSMDGFGVQEALVEREPLLLSSRAAARLLGVDIRTFQGVAQAMNLTVVSTGRTRLWRRLEIERLAAIRESA
jgi:hypothetical protein